MSWIYSLPGVNALLNTTSAILLFTAWIYVRRGNVAVHRRLMIAALVTSTIFLSSYLFYHYFAGSTRFTGTGWVRPVYFGILLTHTVLAMLVPPLAIISVWNGLKMRVETHRRFARWAFPIWMYVSVTGVLVYLFLYQWFPGPPRVVG